MTQASTLDRIASKFESTASHYIANRDQLYRLLVKFALITYAITLTYSLSVDIQSYELLMEVPRVAFWVIVSLLSNLLLIALSVGMQSRINAKRSTGITLAALFLLANLATLHLFVFLFGMYAFLNRPFRSQACEWGPTWYRDLVKQLD